MFAFAIKATGDWMGFRTPEQRDAEIKRTQQHGRSKRYAPDDPTLQALWAVGDDMDRLILGLAAVAGLRSDEIAHFPTIFYHPQARDLNMNTRGGAHIAIEEECVCERCPMEVTVRPYRPKTGKGGQVVTYVDARGRTRPVMERYVDRTVSAWHPKTEKGARSIPLWQAPSVVEVVERVLGRDGGYWTNTVAIRRRVDAMYVRAGIIRPKAPVGRKRMPVHGMRAAAAMRFVANPIVTEASAVPGWLQDTMGWTSMATAMTYIMDGASGRAADPFGGAP
jgi:hypothetical protein